MAATLIRLSGWAEQGGALAVTSGTTSVTKMQASYPGCTIQVYATGGTVLQSIYSNAAGTVSTANPFTTGATGAFGFYIADGRYDLRFSGTGITSPFTHSDITVGPGNDARLGGYINIIAYGAVGDNSTDNSAALTSAQAAATAAGAALYIPAGTFRTVGGFAFTVPVEFAPGTSIIKHVGGSLSFSKSITADPSQHFASSSSLVVTFSGNKTLPDFYPQWWGVVADWNGSTGTDNSTAFQAMIDGVPNGAHIIIPAGTGLTNSSGIGLNSQITLTNRKSLLISGPTTNPQRYAMQFVWLNAGGGTMFKLDYSQEIGFRGLGFFVPSGKVITKFIDIDGYNAAGISTQNFIDACYLDASNQSNAAFKAISISDTEHSNNNENMQVTNTIIYGSSGTRGTAAGIGIYNGANANAKHQKFYNNQISNCQYGIKSDNGSFDVDGLGGGFNSVDVKVPNGATEPVLLAHMETEGSSQQADIGVGPAPITFAYCRGANTNQTNAGGYMKLDGIVVIEESQYTDVPPVGGTIYDGNTSGNLLLTLRNNRYHSSAGMTMAQAGFTAMAALGVGIQVYARGEVGLNDSPSGGIGFFDITSTGTGYLSVQSFQSLYLVSVTFANLVLAGGSKFGQLAAVSDSTTSTPGAIITGGSTNKVLAFYNGTNWVVVR